MVKLKKLYFKHKELILYIFFGGLTTLVNIMAYALFAHLLGVDEIISTVIAFVISVIFAFVTNRRYVFCSNAVGIKSVTIELLKFFSSRIVSGGFDVLLMFIFVTQMGINDMIVKILSNIVVIILNFIFSKMFVFKGNKE